MRYMLSVIAGLSLFLILASAFDGAYIRYAVSRIVPGMEETAKIKEAVTEFNNRFMDVYASEAKREAVYNIPATAGMRHRLTKDASFVGMGGRVLVYDLASLEIKSVRMDGPIRATVLASEDWNFQYKNDKTWKSVADVHGAGSVFRYELVRQGGRWLVQNYEPVREEKKGA